MTWLRVCERTDMLDKNFVSSEDGEDSVKNALSVPDDNIIP
jgi:hypothetical protein